MTEEEREKYLATECFHPRKVTNKYTHETLFVRCGTCPSCLVHRSNIQCALISNMSSHFGVNVPASDSHMAQYIGGVARNLDISEVVNNNLQGDGEAVIYGKGVGTGTKNRYHYTNQNYKK
jgi:hypothetical protein